MIQGLKVCQLALHFGADDMDGTHGSTDEERIYHSAGTHSGQYVDDREFRRLIEEAGYVPVRRNSTYEEFSWDWAPDGASTGSAVVRQTHHDTGARHDAGGVAHTAVNA
jgi:hypothetical protein